MPMAYDNFDLFIDRGPAGYQAHATSSFGRTSVDFTLPEAELAAFLGRSLGLTRAVLALPSATTPPSAQEIGERLYQAVFAGTVGRDLLRSLDDADRRGLGLRLRISVDRRLAALVNLPWEYLYSPELARFLARSELTPVVRYPVEVPHRVEPLRVLPPLTVLGVVSNPADAPPLAVEKEWRQLEAALGGLQQRGLLRVERLPKATLAGLLDRLGQAPPVHVLHFIGHGFFDPAEGQGGLIFENDDGLSRSVPAEMLAVMTDHPVLRLAFLNACEGAASGRSDPFAGVAQRLVQQGLPAVVAMQFPVSDRAAIALAQSFYSALAEGDPVDRALGRARKAAAAEGNELEWGTPVLFSRSDDNQLIELPQGDARPVIELRQPAYEPETVLIPGGPFLIGAIPAAGVPDIETPQHELNLPDYRIGLYPITNIQYLEFARQTGAAVAPEAGWVPVSKGQAPPAGLEKHPVVAVSWDDAMAYCRWLSERTGRLYRLPSEAEWEKAARGVDGRRFPWGDAFEAERCNGKPAGRAAPTAVGAFSPAGDSPFGCADMAGNVWEWTRTLWGREHAVPDYAYPYRAKDGREAAEPASNPPRELRIARGGSFRDAEERLTCTARTRFPADSRHPARGFRVVVDLTASSASRPPERPNA